MRELHTFVPDEEIVEAGAIQADACHGRAVAMKIVARATDDGVEIVGVQGLRDQPVVTVGAGVEVTDGRRVIRGGDQPVGEVVDVLGLSCGGQVLDGVQELGATDLGDRDARERENFQLRPGGLEPDDAPITEDNRSRDRTQPVGRDESVDVLVVGTRGVEPYFPPVATVPRRFICRSPQVVEERSPDARDIRYEGLVPRVALGCCPVLRIALRADLVQVVLEDFDELRAVLVSHPDRCSLRPVAFGRLHGEQQPLWAAGRLPVTAHRSERVQLEWVGGARAFKDEDRAECLQLFDVEAELTACVLLLRQYLVEVATQSHAVCPALDRPEAGVASAAAAMEVFIRGVLDDVEVIEVPQLVSQGSPTGAQPTPRSGRLGPRARRLA